MESIEKYNVLRVKRVEMTKEEEIASLEREMYYLLEENMRMHDIVLKAERAKEKLDENRKRILGLVEKLKGEGK